MAGVLVPAHRDLDVVVASFVDQGTGHDSPGRFVQLARLAAIGFAGVVVDRQTVECPEAQAVALGFVQIDSSRDVTF